MSGVAPLSVLFKAERNDPFGVSAVPGVLVLLLAAFDTIRSARPLSFN